MFPPVKKDGKGSSWDRTVLAKALGQGCMVSGAALPGLLASAVSGMMGTSRREALCEFPRLAVTKSYKLNCLTLTAIVLESDVCWPF